jgi:hypothetical protein
LIILVEEQMMQISTFYEGEQVNGVILEHTRFFLKVEITSPYSNSSTSLSVPYFERAHTQFLGEVLVSRCDALLIELYEFGKTKEKHLSELSRKFCSSEIPALSEELIMLENDLPFHKLRLRKSFHKKEITQKAYQAGLKEARRSIDAASKKLDTATDAFFAGTPFDSCSYDQKLMLVDELESDQ